MEQRPDDAVREAVVVATHLVRRQRSARPTRRRDRELAIAERAGSARSVVPSQPIQSLSAACVQRAESSGESAGARFERERAIRVDGTRDRQSVRYDQDAPHRQLTPSAHAALACFEQLADRHRGVDEPDVGVGLREVAEQPPVSGSMSSEKSPTGLAWPIRRSKTAIGVVEPAHERERLGPPERADRERARGLAEVVVVA